MLKTAMQTQLDGVKSGFIHLKTALSDIQEVKVNMKETEDTQTWHWLMVVAELMSLSFYLITLILSPGYFDDQFIQTKAFLWKVIVLTLVSWLPLWMVSKLLHKINPPSYQKLV